MKVPRSLVEERIRSRGRDVENILLQLESAWKNYEDFSRTHQVDFILENSTNEELIIEELIQKINMRQSDARRKKP